MPGQIRAGRIDDDTLVLCNQFFSKVVDCASCTRHKRYINSEQQQSGKHIIPSFGLRCRPICFPRCKRGGRLPAWPVSAARAGLADLRPYSGC